MSRNQIYLHRSMAPDVLLGRVDADGKVYETRIGPDKYVGRVDPRNGKIYAAQIGPDDYLGRVDLDDGKVYRALLGPDEYLGRVEQDGSMHYHQPMARDLYVGKMEDIIEIAFGGAAFLLLVLPEVEASLTDDDNLD